MDKKNISCAIEGILFAAGEPVKTAKLAAVLEVDINEVEEAVKLLKYNYDNLSIRKYPDDEDLLEDVIIENKQAIEMANIYSNILSGTMDAFASIISNNLNIVMKFLAAMTIVMAIPTMISGFFGMNVPVPFAQLSWAFYLICGGTAIICAIVVLILYKKKMF
mgnify:CR=1 FL=1